MKADPDTENLGVLYAGYFSAIRSESSELRYAHPGRS